MRFRSALAHGLAAAWAASFAAAAPAGAQPPAASLPGPLAAGWQGESVCEKLHEDEHHRILRCTFPPGVGHEWHEHPPHFGYAIAGGRQRIESAGGVREVDVPDGATWVREEATRHETVNIGERTSVYLIVEPK